MITGIYLSLNSLRNVLAVTLILVVGVLSAQDRKPNIIVILADDLGYADLSVNGSHQIATPNIDRLASEGVQFTQAYVSAPVCSPSRAGLLTGRNQVEFGYDNNLSNNQPGFDPQYAGLPVNQKTIAERLKTDGYVTGIIGKWHLGEEERFHPVNRGFDEFWGYLNGGHDYFTSKEGEKGSLAPLESNFKNPAPITYITDDHGTECVDFIKRHKDSPFFLYASFNAPHAPMQATKEDLKLFSHIKDEKRRTYLAMVHRLDVNIGRIIKALAVEGLEENTLIVFLSDNGGPVDQNAALNAPLNGQKGILMEGGLRIPMFMRWKGTLPEGTVFTKAVSSLDLTPTFVSAAGISISTTDEFSGTDLLPYILGKKRGNPHDVLMWKFTISAAIIQDNWKLIRLPDRMPMLFNIKEDISEQDDLATKYPERVDSMLKILGDWDVSLPHPLFLEGAEWKRKQLDLYDKEYPLVQPSGGKKIKSQ